MKKLVLSIVVAMMVLGSVNCFATNLYCDGYVDNVLVSNVGNLTMTPSFRNDTMFMCNIDSLTNGVTPESCKAWFKTLASALVAGHQVKVAYLNLPNGTTCASLPSKVDSPAASYIMLMNN